MPPRSTRPSWSASRPRRSTCTSTGTRRRSTSAPSTPRPPPPESTACSATRPTRNTPARSTSPSPRPRSPPKPKPRARSTPCSWAWARWHCWSARSGWPTSWSSPSSNAARRSACAARSAPPKATSASSSCPRPSCSRPSAARPASPQARRPPASTPTTRAGPPSSPPRPGPAASPPPCSSAPWPGCWRRRVAAALLPPPLPPPPPTARGRCTTPSACARTASLTSPIPTAMGGSPMPCLRRVMWVDLRWEEPGQVEPQQSVSGDGRGGTGEQPPEAVGAVAGQFHQVGDLAEAGLYPVAPLGDDLLQDRRHAPPLILRGRDEHGGAAGGLLRGECGAVEPLVREQVTRRRPGLQQVCGDLALVDRGGHDAPCADDAAAKVGLDREPEPVEPFGVRGVAAEPGVQAIEPGPPVRPADPRWVLDRQRRGIDLLAVIGRLAGREGRPELLERPPTASGSAGWPRFDAAAPGTGGPSPG